MVVMPKSKKIIFLDIDGVLNNEMSAKVGVHLMPAKVLKIKDICDATGADVVISSTWRKNNDLKTLKTLLWAGGLSWKHDVVGVTPDHCRGHRGSEIEMYMTQHPEVGDFVIIDDDSDMLDYQKRDHFVQTHWSTGIMDEHVEKAIELLGRK